MSNCIPVEIPITIEQGGTFDKPYSWSIETSSGVLVAVDLTGHKGRAVIKEKMNSPSPLFVLNYIEEAWYPGSQSGVYMTSDQWRMYINDEDTATLCKDRKTITGFYTCYIENQYGETVVKQYGPVNIKVSA